ncbi:hypothetical protein [Rhodopirellula sp. MGV]|uniref:hypothetical protein n=1 Tax=Rhodopirellula sp. MGV TaxID=2023130 RepID=UPI000B95F133|nr:hypothetical protein [Rhodopirellula sp. MGV]OYP38273.1 hypothetical protein CGZ80_03395 [Rhodopirellula sp. MGV]PNY38611.1 hypothetical protein C2E31_01450 [Rhodopirellula baltica]
MDPPQFSGRQSTAEAVLPSRLLPRISFRSLFALTTVCAVVTAVVSAAGHGGAYATAGAIAIAFVFGCFAIFALCFLLSWSVAMFPRAIGAALMVVGVHLAFTRFVGVTLRDWAFLQSTAVIVCFELLGLYLVVFPTGRERPDDANSPFADGQLPPQIFAPRDPTE